MKRITITNINLNSGGECICLWVNPLNPDKDSTVTLPQKLQISFVMELTCDIDVKINYSPRISSQIPIGIYQDGLSTGGKVVALPCQVVPTDVVSEYWIYGDALRPTHRNQL